MSFVTIRLVATDAVTGAESILTKIDSDQYDPDQLNGLVNTCLTQGIAEIKGADLLSLRSLCPEISVVLTTDGDESIRPSLHLSSDTLLRLSEAGASFDFDPYC